MALTGETGKSRRRPQHVTPNVKAGRDSALCTEYIYNSLLLLTYQIFNMFIYDYIIYIHIYIYSIYSLHITADSLLIFLAPIQLICIDAFDSIPNKFRDQFETVPRPPTRDEIWTTRARWLCNFGLYKSLYSILYSLFMLFHSFTLHFAKPNARACLQQLKVFRRVLQPS